MISEQKADEVKSYFSERKMVIFQAQHSVRAHLDALFRDLKIELEVHKAQSCSEALEYINNNKDIFFLTQTSNDEEASLLFEALDRTGFSRNPTVIFIADAFNEKKILDLALRRVDGCLSVPLTREKLLKQICQGIESSTFRKNYVKVVESAAKMLEEGEARKAKKYIEAQLRLSKRPALSHCLLAEIFMSQKYFEQALENFLAALKHSPNDLRGLKGLYCLFGETGHVKRAYSILKKIFALYPANPEDLCQAFRLCIQIDQWEDMEKFIELYFLYRDIDPKLDRHAAAAISVYCQRLLGLGEFEMALMEAERLKKFRLPRGVFLNPIIFKLRELGKPREINRLLTFYRKEDLRHPDYKLATYYSHCVNESEEETARYALKIIGEGVENPLLYKETIKRLARLGNSKRAQDLKTKASKLWPEFAQ